MRQLIINLVLLDSPPVCLRRWGSTEISDRCGTEYTVLCAQTGVGIVFEVGRLKRMHMGDQGCLVAPNAVRSA